eukprot:TRINITY_DN17333_c0_g1_i1.p1 TRINITY_DN17333_c0_g1~~TRINITY_DN17333_c0_g1_i1.p1  ORF type:complete len:423 (+),score=118.77 TRINITY_DN17333_c0_g1_i1:93-1361(+)
MQQAEDCTRIFCGNLPADITDEEMRMVFNTYGQVTEVKIIDDKKSANKCSFVTYSMSEGGAAAIQVLNNVYKFRPDSEHPIRVSVCKPKNQYREERGIPQDSFGGGKGGGFKGDGGWGGGGGGGDAPADARRLFVGQLPMDITVDEIKMVFNTYGSVTDVSIIDGKPPGTHKCAFVVYETEEAGRTAIQVLHHVYKFRHDSEKPINVDCQKSRRDGGKGKDGGKGGGGGWGGRDDGPYGGGKGGYGGGGYGGGYDAGKGKGGYDDGKGYGKGGGYGGGGGGYTDGKGRPYDEGKGKGYGGGYGDKGKGGKAEAPPGPKLYISNLPGDIDPDTLRTVFSTYGQLVDVHIMTGRSNDGQSSAFVSYSSEPEATQCLQAMSQGYEIRPGQGNIRVTYALPRNKGDKGGDKGFKGGDKGGYGKGKY